MTMTPAIHVAYATSRKNGPHARARAFVAERFDGRTVKHSFTICIEDTAESAVAGAVEYVREMYRREGLAAPSPVIEHGRKPGAVVDSLVFGPRAGE